MSWLRCAYGHTIGDAWSDAGGEGAVVGGREGRRWWGGGGVRSLTTSPGSVSSVDFVVTLGWNGAAAADSLLLALPSAPLQQGRLNKPRTVGGNRLITAKSLHSTQKIQADYELKNLLTHYQVAITLTLFHLVHFLSSRPRHLQIIQVLLLLK